MQGVPFLLPIWFDLTATFLLAATGVWAAARRGYDIVGAVVLAFVAGAGGGLMRDRVFMNQVPVVMNDPRYLWAIIAAILVGLLLRRAADRFAALYLYVDALALGIYGVVGANKALLAGLAPLPAVAVGMVNAVGGGLLRDVLVREEPELFKPGQVYVLAALGGCLLYVALSTLTAIETNYAAWIGVGVVLVLRLLAIRFNWTTSGLSH